MMGIYVGSCDITAMQVAVGPRGLRAPEAKQLRTKLPRYTHNFMSNVHGDYV